jgi:tetratricopeptide (TPR) repeat protein
MRLYPDSEIEGAYLSLPSTLLAERTVRRLQQLQSEPDVSEMIALGRVMTDVDPGRKTRALDIARRLLTDAMAAAPDNASARYNYGRTLKDRSHREAIAEWQKALALSPAPDLQLQIYTQIGLAKDALYDFAGAEQAFTAALEINRKLPTRVPEPALEYVRFLQVRSRVTEAEAVLNEVLAWNPWSPEARAERARLLADTGHWQQAIEEGSFVLRNAGENKALLRTAHALLARAYHGLEQPEKAQVHSAWLQKH